MRFTRYPIRKAHTPGPTPQRLAAARKAIAKQQESWELFAPVMEWPTPELRIKKIDAGRVEDVFDDRDHRAAQWRNARQVLRSLAPFQREAVLAYWDQQTMTPGDPFRLVDMVDSYLMGNLDPRGKLRELERCRLLGEIMREVDSILALPRLPIDGNKEDTFLRLHVGREIAQARRPDIFPQLEGEGDAFANVQRRPLLSY